MQTQTAREIIARIEGGTRLIGTIAEFLYQNEEDRMEFVGRLLPTTSPKDIQLVAGMILKAVSQAFLASGMVGQENREAMVKEIASIVRI